MLTYSFTNTGSDSMYEYLYKCIRNDITQGKIKRRGEAAVKAYFCKKSGHKRDHSGKCLWTIIQQKVIFIPCQSGDFMSQI